MCNCACVLHMVFVTFLVITSILKDFDIFVINRTLWRNISQHHRNEGSAYSQCAEHLIYVIMFQDQKQKVYGNFQSSIALLISGGL